MLSKICFSYLRCSHMGLSDLFWNTGNLHSELSLNTLHMRCSWWEAANARVVNAECYWKCTHINYLQNVACTNIQLNLNGNLHVSLYRAICAQVWCCHRRLLLDLWSVDSESLCLTNYYFQHQESNEFWHSVCNMLVFIQSLTLFQFLKKIFCRSWVLSTNLKSQQHRNTDVLDEMYPTSAKYLSSFRYNTVWEIIKTHMKVFNFKDLRCMWTPEKLSCCIWLLTISYQTNVNWCINRLLVIKYN